MKKKLVIGLGNPGKKYRNTKHNIGFISLDSYAKSKKLKFKKSIKFNAELIEEQSYILFKPKTYMNNSGMAVEKVVNFYNIETEDILVIHDDLDLPFGKLKLKQKGGSGGHNGLKSIISYLGSEEFKRLKFGIDKNPDIDTKDYVLKEFNKAQEKEVNDRIIDIINIIDIFINNEPFNNIMTKYN
jgi:peptidyl-tRNA hydrolase, PTH1 family